MRSIRVAVIGAGGIGSSVAHAFAELGDSVTVIDRNPAALEVVKVSIRRTHLARLFRRATTLTLNETLDRIEYSTDLSDAASSDVVVENVPEDVKVKRGVHRSLASLSYTSHPIIAVNSSAIPVELIQHEHNHPSRIIGLHLMNPVIETKSAEVIRSSQTGRETEAQLLAILHAREFLAVTINDDVGYAVNRALMPFINEAIGSVRRGTASAAEIDQLFVNSLKHQQGPLALADLIGLDTIHKTLEVLVSLTGDIKYTPDALLSDMVVAGKLGRKVGQGFFKYGVASVVRP